MHTRNRSGWISVTSSCDRPRLFPRVGTIQADVATFIVAAAIHRGGRSARLRSGWRVIRSGNTRDADGGRHPVCTPALNQVRRCPRAAAAPWLLGLEPLLLLDAVGRQRLKSRWAPMVCPCADRAIPGGGFRECLGGAWFVKSFRSYVYVKVESIGSQGPKKFFELLISGVADQNRQEPRLCGSH